MKRFRLPFCSIAFLLFTYLAPAQTAKKVTYSAVKKESVKNVKFEILGKIGSNYIVFKNIDWRNIIQIFDKEMKELSNERIKYIPQKILNVDFVTYPDYFLMIYQHKKNTTVYCDAVKVDANGQKIGEVITIDTTKVGAQSGEDIYSMVYSENKKNVLVYKMHERNDRLNIVTKLYNQDLQLLDSTRSLIQYDDRKELYGPFNIANDGSIYFTRETKVSNRDNIGALELISNKINTNVFHATEVNIGKHFIDGVQLKIDNLNQHCIINSFYYPNKRGSNIEGLFSAIITIETDSIKTFFNKFDDSLRLQINKSKDYKTAFDNLFLNNIFVKKDGGYFLVAEDFSTQTLGNNNSWNRYDYLYGNPYSNSYNNSYYSNSPYNRYNGFNNNNYRTEIYYYENLLIMNIDSSLELKWNTVINKKQIGEGEDRFISYGTLNLGSEVHFLFLEKNNNVETINNQSVNGSGRVFRYPTVKTMSGGHQFMPRLAKQVSARELFVPCSYRGDLCFALIIF